MSAKLSKNVEEEEMPKRDVLSLYNPKGKTGIEKKIASMIAQALSQKDDDFLEWFAEEFELENDKLESIKVGKEPIDFQFFGKVKESLDLSIHDLLQKPSYNGERDYWKKQLVANPMLLAAPTGAQEEANILTQKENWNEDIELQFYVRLRAISALLR